MKKIFKNLISIVKFLIVILLIFIVLSYGFKKENNSMEKTFGLIALFIVLLPTVFVFFIKDELMIYPKFANFWKTGRILYAILMILFVSTLLLSFL